jgi:hypothetical protein
VISEDPTPDALAIELRRVLDAYRDGISPGAAQQAALWQRLDAPIGAAAIAKASLGLRVILGGLIVGATTIVGVAVSRPDSPRPERTTTVVAPAALRRSVPAEPEAAEAPSEAAIAPAGGPPPTPRPVAASPRERRAASVTPPVDAPAAAGTLTEELALLERARIELGRGRPTDALALVAEHARAFPRGQMQ